MNDTALASAIATQWDAQIVPAITDYIRIPAKSPHFDPQWEAHGHIERVIRLAEAWAKKQPIAGLVVEIVRLPGRTPLLYFDIPATGKSNRSILLYGHLDKQPEMIGWRDGHGPWDPLYEDGKLYGRGGAGDGYAIFAALSAIGALQAQGVAHARCVGMIETCEESGATIFRPISTRWRRAWARSSWSSGSTRDAATTSGCGQRRRCAGSSAGRCAWKCSPKACTRAMQRSGAVAFRIARALLDRVEDSATGCCPTRSTRRSRRGAQQAQRAAKLPPSFNSLKAHVLYQRLVHDRAQALLNRTWRPALSITGADGMPAIADAGNVLRPQTSLKLSLRVPPVIDGERAATALKRVLEADPPYGARVSFDAESSATGWNAPVTAAWLAKAIDEASSRFYGKPAAAMGEGGTIPFMAMLGKHFPDAQFLITGVLGPHANAHGPNEFLHVPTPEAGRRASRTSSRRWH
jgi:acetylornithine deacetylase/succinyl-diaminopimelate desuccinylase-like protein